MGAAGATGRRRVGPQFSTTNLFLIFWRVGTDPTRRSVKFAIFFLSTSVTKQQSPTGRRPVGDVTSDPRITMKSPAKPTTSHPSEIRHRNEIQNFFTTLKTKIRNRNCTRSRTEINFRGEPMNGRMSAADVGDAADRNKPLLRRVKNRGMSPADVGDAADRKKRSRRINHRVSPPDVGDMTD